MMDYICYILLAFFWLGAACIFAVGVVFSFTQGMFSGSKAHLNYFDDEDAE